MPSGSAFLGIAGFGIALVVVLVGAVYDAYKNRPQREEYRYPRPEPNNEQRAGQGRARGPAVCAFCRSSLAKEDIDHCRNPQCAAVFHVRCAGTECVCGRRLAA